KNSQLRTWPVGSLKPNDWGLFDVQGGVLSWCQESYKRYPTGKEGEVVEDREDDIVIVSTLTRVLRGGSFSLPASVARSALRTGDAPATRFYYYGFRPARTFTP